MQRSAESTGTGGEWRMHFGEKRFELNDGKVEKRHKEGQDHFDYGQHVVRLSPSVFKWSLFNPPRSGRSTK